MRLTNNILLTSGLVMLLAAGISSCSEMDDYKQYISDGETRYSGRADSVTAYPGRNRILLSWLLIADPNITACKVYWNNGADSAGVTVQKSAAIDTVYLMLEDLPERTYNFEIYTFDTAGNRSVAVFESGTVFGEEYEATLLPKQVTRAWQRKDSTYLDWSAAEESAIAVELEYTASSGDLKKIIVPPAEIRTNLTDYKRGSAFRYRTLYLPDSLAIDTFYTPYAESEALYELDRASWTISGFSSEESSGEGEDNGHAIHALDNNTGTFWHTQWEGEEPGPPHYIAFDMGATETINGIYFEPRLGSENGNARDVGVEVSLNGTDWEDAGNFILPNDENRHLVHLEPAVRARYVKVTVNTTHGDQASTFFAEIGAF